MISPLRIFTRHANVRFNLTLKVVIWAIRASRWFMVSPGASYRLRVNTTPGNASKESFLNRTCSWSITRACGLTLRIRLGARSSVQGPNPIFFLRTPILLILLISNLIRKMCISSQKKSEIQKTGSCDCALGHGWGPRIGSGWIGCEGLKIIGTPLRGAQNVRSGGVPFLMNKNVNKAVSSRSFDVGKPGLRSLTWTWTSLRCRSWVEFTRKDTLRILLQN